MHRWPAIAAFLLPVTGNPQDAFFLRTTPIPLGGIELVAPLTVVAADFDGNGRPDLAVGGAAVTIMLGDGAGQFTLSRTVAVAGQVGALLSVDIDGNGYADVVSADAGGQLTILRSAGDGAFLPPVAIALSMSGPPASSIASADFNGDGRPDLAIAFGAGSVSVLLNAGGVAFRAGPTIPPHSGPYNSRAVAADFSGDGIPDLAVGRNGGSSIALYRGRGDGTFEAAQAVEVCRDPGVVWTSDVNRDGAPDLLVASVVSDGIWLLTGSGSGFRGAVRLEGSSGRAWSIAAGDFNGDGWTDVASTQQGAGVSVAFGRPDGGFQPFRNLPVGPIAIALAPADFNGDSMADLAVVTPVSESVAIVHGSSSGEFTSGAVLGRVQAKAPIAGRFLGGGAMALAILSQTLGSVLLAPFDSEGRPGAAVRHPVGTLPNRMFAADLNGDGLTDLVGGSQTDSGLWWLPGSPDGGFLAARRISAAEPVTPLAVADADGDGVPDLIVALAGASPFGDASVAILKGGGDGTFLLPRIVAAGQTAAELVAADFTFDAALDLIYYEPGRGMVFARGKGDGSFDAPAALETRLTVNLPAVADLDRDGRPDLILFDPASAELSVFMNRNGELVRAGTARAVEGVAAAAFADLNGDAHPDLAVASGAGRVAVLFGNGDGSFQPARSFPLSESASGIAALDLNGDGRPDLAVTHSRGASILWNDPAPPLPPVPSRPVPISPVSGAAIQQNNPASGCQADPVRGAGFVIRFEWTPPPPAEGVTGYELNASNPSARQQLVDSTLPPVPIHEFRHCGFLPDAALEGWEWRVRALGSGSAKSEWSATAAFRLLPCRLAAGTACGTPPPGGAFSPTGSLATARARHSATLLAGGKVLIAGGDTYDGRTRELASTELYDVQQGTFAPGPSMRAGRSGHTATLLADGRVLFAGGVAFPPPPGQPSPTISAEVYDPAANQFRAAGNMLVPRTAHSAVLLPDGRVLIAGGFSAFPVSYGLATSEIFDPATGAFSSGPPMAFPRYSHTATALANGQALIAGGAGSPNMLNEAYDPRRGAFTVTSPPIFPQFSHTATLLPGNQVLLAGGWVMSAPSSSAQVWDGDTGRYGSVGPMPIPRQNHAAAVLCDSSVLLTGGVAPPGNARHPAVERYIPSSRQFLPVTPMVVQRAEHTATALPDGRVLIVGGTGGNDSGIYWLNAAELYLASQ